MDTTTYLIKLSKCTNTEELKNKFGLRDNLEILVRCENPEDTFYRIRDDISKGIVAEYEIFSELDTLSNEEKSENRDLVKEIEGFERDNIKICFKPYWVSDSHGELKRDKATDTLRVLKEEFGEEFDHQLYFSLSNKFKWKGEEDIDKSLLNIKNMVIDISNYLRDQNLEFYIATYNSKDKNIRKGIHFKKS